jgi:hypothetical protein
MAARTPPSPLDRHRAARIGLTRAAESAGASRRGSETT